MILKSLNCGNPQEPESRANPNYFDVAMDELWVEIVKMKTDADATAWNILKPIEKQLKLHMASILFLKIQKRKASNG